LSDLLHNREDGGGENGFTVTGAGFLVNGVGDLNDDGIKDLMITAFDNWQNLQQGNAYLIIPPKNVSYSPSLQPSSQPSSKEPSFSPSKSIVSGPTNSQNHNSNSSNITSIDSSASPTPSPSPKPTADLSLKPTRTVFTTGTDHPTAPRPSRSPTLSPTSGYQRLRGLSTPSASPTTFMPTINASIGFWEVDCSKSGFYDARKNDSNVKFVLTAQSGTVSLSGNEDGGAKNLYVLQTCPTDRVNVAISNFRLATDILSVAHLADSDYSYPSLYEISYFVREGSGQPLTFFFCEGNKLQVILSSHSSFDLSESNFIFAARMGNSGKHSHQSIANALLEQIPVLITLIVLMILFLCVCAVKPSEEKDLLSSSAKNKKEQVFSPSFYEQDNNDRNVCSNFSSCSSLSGLLRPGRGSNHSLSKKNFGDDENDDLLSSLVWSGSSASNSNKGMSNQSHSLGSQLMELFMNIPDENDDPEDIGNDDSDDYYLETDDDGDDVESLQEDEAQSGDLLSEDGMN
jgi:hypothetical protein